MTIFRSLLSGIVCVSLPIASISIASADGDVAKPFKDSTNNSVVKRGTMTIKPNNIEENLTDSFSPPSPFRTSILRCDLSTQQTMDLDAKNYRWYNEDVNDTFVDPVFSGHTLQTARLCITYNDVDFTSYHAYTPELDVVQLGSTTIGILPGNDGERLTKCWNATSRLRQNIGANIPFIVNVDAAHDYRRWAVYLEQAVLSTCHTRITTRPYPFPINSNE